MRRHSKGQSLVEMALMLPMLLLVLFGIIDLGYYIYGYSTIYFAARNGTEIAAELPPMPNKLNDPNDGCTRAIFNATQQGVVLFSDFSTNNVTISYPNGTTSRALSQPIEVRVQYAIQPLTPLFRLARFGDSQGRLTVNIAARRTIESLGNGPITALNPDGIVC
jgi:Flp pilus assembly protein TadG